MFDMEHLKFLEEVSAQDLEVIREKESTYMGSWKRRDGKSVFHMVARMWDRTESITNEGEKGIFQIIREQNYRDSDGNLRAVLSDLRRYLTLIEAQMLSEIDSDTRQTQWSPSQLARVAASQLARVEGGTPPRMQMMDVNTEQVNDRVEPGSVVPPDEKWLRMKSIPAAYSDFYQWSPHGNSFVLKRSVPPIVYEKMPHSMQALYVQVQDVLHLKTQYK